MSTSPPRSVETFSDELDRLLKAYFQLELPTCWPPAPDTEIIGSMELASSERPMRRDWLTPSRWALAASVAALAGLCGLLFNASSSPPRPPVAKQPSPYPSATAGDGPILQEMSRQRALNTHPGVAP